MKISLSTLAVFIIFCLTSFDIRTTDNFFTVGNNRYPLSFSEIANESYNTKSKFEVDLISDGQALANAKTYIWFSLTSNNTASLSDGIYQFSSAAVNGRLPFQFNGSVRINDHIVKVAQGTISIENRDQEYDIHFILKLQNGDVAKGIYRGLARKSDRSHTYK